MNAQRQRLHRPWHREHDLAFLAGAPLDDLVQGRDRGARHAIDDEPEGRVPEVHAAALRSGLETDAHAQAPLRVRAVLGRQRDDRIGRAAHRGEHRVGRTGELDLGQGAIRGERLRCRRGGGARVRWLGHRRWGVRRSGRCARRRSSVRLRRAARPQRPGDRADDHDADDERRHEPRGRAAVDDGRRGSAASPSSR